MSTYMRSGRVYSMAGYFVVRQVFGAAENNIHFTVTNRGTGYPRAHNQILLPDMFSVFIKQVMLLHPIDSNKCKKYFKLGMVCEDTNGALLENVPEDVFYGEPKSVIAIIGYNRY